MNKAFTLIETEKQEKIIDVCMAEFAVHGYEKASTNRIVQLAGISKGTLFNYFGSKRELFLDIVKLCAERFAVASLETNKHEREIALARGDIFELLKTRGLRKLKTALEHPVWYSILYNAFIDLDDDMKEDAADKLAPLKKLAEDDLKKYVDVTLFKEDVDVDKSIEIIQLFLEGYFHRQQGILKNQNRISGHNRDEKSLENIYKDMSEECDAYLDELKKAFYKS